jgi:hypothetical protein
MVGEFYICRVWVTDLHGFYQEGKKNQKRRETGAEAKIDSRTDTTPPQQRLAARWGQLRWTLPHQRRRKAVASSAAAPAKQSGGGAYVAAREAQQQTRACPLSSPRFRTSSPALPYPTPTAPTVIFFWPFESWSVPHQSRCVASLGEPTEPLSRANVPTWHQVSVV